LKDWKGLCVAADKILLVETNGKAIYRKGLALKSLFEFDDALDLFKKYEEYDIGIEILKASNWTVT
jgi:hypothetical protein